jgi:hypothetical protein
VNNQITSQAAAVVDHLPPANGAEDVYTLLKTYTISSTLVGSF